MSEVLFSPEGALFLSPGHRPGENDQGSCGLKDRASFSHEVAVPQSLARVLVHVVFSTKHREPLLAKPARDELHAYLSGVLNNDGCTSLRVGGFDDHVHLLFALSRTRTIAQVIENVKTSSSKWLKTKGAALAAFHWQNGYGIYSVSQSHADAVVAYIAGQEEHHTKQRETYQDEVRRLYCEAHIEFDERYVWD